MPVLHLGVENLPYARRGRSTGFVAEVLERRYGIMEFFVEKHGQEVADAYTQALVEAMEQRREVDFKNAMYAAKGVFSAMVRRRELDGKPGVPTEASKHRSNHVSFWKTGQYVRDFRIWVDK